MTSEEILNKIKEWCFSQTETTYKDHNLFQKCLVDSLRENGWDSYIEYEVENFSSLSARTGKIKDNIGFIDIVGFGYNKKLVIEYDTANTMKFVSICKLFCSNANFLIGIFRGKRGKPFLVYENKVKIKKIARELGFVDKSIFIIALENKIAESINV